MPVAAPVRGGDDQLEVGQRDCGRTPGVPSGEAPSAAPTRARGCSSLSLPVREIEDHGPRSPVRRESEKLDLDHRARRSGPLIEVVVRRLRRDGAKTRPVGLDGKDPGARSLARSLAPERISRPSGGSQATKCAGRPVPTSWIRAVQIDHGQTSEARGCDAICDAVRRPVEPDSSVTGPSRHADRSPSASAIIEATGAVQRSTSAVAEEQQRGAVTGIGRREVEVPPPMTSVAADVAGSIA